MLIRSVFVGCVFVIAVIFAWLHPPPRPEHSEQSRWIKIDTNGKPLAAWEGPWKCVLDSKTQLLWEVKSYAEDIHDHQCSFSWFEDGVGVAKHGDCFIEGEASDTSDLITSANTLRNCGKADWRLPTEQELKTLIIDHPKPGEPMISRDYFPFSKNAPYWTSNNNQTLEGHFQHLNVGALSVNFSTGESQSMPYKNAAYVRLVTSAKKERLN